MYQMNHFNSFISSSFISFFQTDLYFSFLNYFIYLFTDGRMDFPEINCSVRDSVVKCRYFFRVRTYIVTIIVIIVRVNNKSMVEILIHTHRTDKNPKFILCHRHDFIMKLNINHDCLTGSTHPLILRSFVSCFVLSVPRNHSGCFIAVLLQL